MKIEYKHIFEHARENGYAIGAFNVANLETLKAVVHVAFKLKSPVIIEASAGEVEYMGVHELKALVDVYRQKTELPILLNLDHAIDELKIDEAIEVGFDLIHADASTLPLDQNIELTKKAVHWSHEQNLLCEGEMDHIQGSSDDHRKDNLNEIVRQGMYTDPDQALKYIEATGVDIFAAFFGNAHGLYREAKELDFDLLDKLVHKTNVFLSMHGSSGVRDEDLKKAIQIGKIVKVNMNSELRVAYRETLEQSLKNTASVKLYEYMEDVVKRVEEVVGGRIKVLGSENKAPELIRYIDYFYERRNT